MRAMSEKLRFRCRKHRKSLHRKLLEQMNEDSVTVAEISSFQLETIEHFHPKVSAILNITPDHLNRHHTMEEYIRVKEADHRQSDGGRHLRPEL